MRTSTHSKKPEVRYSKQSFKNTFNNDVVEHWYGGEVREIEGKHFWLTYNERGTQALLSKESWNLQRQKR